MTLLSSLFSFYGHKYMSQTLTNLTKNNSIGENVHFLIVMITCRERKGSKVEPITCTELKRAQCEGGKTSLLYIPLSISGAIQYGEPTTVIL